MNQTLFLHKYQPLYFKDFESDDEMIDILSTLIKMDNLNILFIYLIKNIFKIESYI